MGERRNIKIRQFDGEKLLKLDILKQLGVPQLSPDGDSDFEKILEAYFARSTSTEVVVKVSIRKIEEEIKFKIRTESIVVSPRPENHQMGNPLNRWDFVLEPISMDECSTRDVKNEHEYNRRMAELHSVLSQLKTTGGERVVILER